MSFVIERLNDFAALESWPKATPPIVAQINEHIPLLCGLPHDYLLRDDPIAMAECSLLVYEYYNLSLLIANLDPYNFEAEAIGQKISYEANRYPDIDRSDYIIKGENDLDKIKFGGLTTGRFPYMVKYAQAYRQYSGQDPSSDGCAPWSLACNIFGADKLIVAAMSKPAFVKEMMRGIVHEYMIPLYKDLMKAIPSRTVYGLADAFASPPLLSPKLFDEYVVKSFDELSSALPELSFSEKGVWGVDEIPEKMRASFANSLIHIGKELQGLDPDVEGIGPEWFRNYADQRQVPLTLGLSSTLLQNGSVEKIVERLKHYVLTGKKGQTPLTVFLNCVSMSTPPDHVHAAIATIKTYGRPGADDNTPLKLPQRESFVDFVRRKKADNREVYSFNWLDRSALKF